MENKFINKYDKKVQEQIYGYIQGKKKLHGDNRFTVEYLMSDFKDTLRSMINVREKLKLAQSESDIEQLLKEKLSSWAGGMKFILFDYIFYERIFNNNLKVFQNGLFTIQRFLFLGDRYYYSRGDANIMMNLRGGLAVYDKDLVESYISELPSPFASGYSLYVSLANGLYFIFDGKLQQASEYLDKRANIKSLTKYERSMLLAVKAIADKNEENFINELSTLLNLYPRQQFYNNLADFINIEAIGLYNLAEQVWGKIPKEPESMYWDSDFVRYSREHKPELIIDFSQISPLFQRWLKELPSEINVSDFIDDIEK